MVVNARFKSSEQETDRIVTCTINFHVRLRLMNYFSWNEVGEQINKKSEDCDVNREDTLLHNREYDGQGSLNHVWMRKRWKTQ